MMRIDVGCYVNQPEYVKVHIFAEERFGLLVRKYDLRRRQGAPQEELDLLQEDIDAMQGILGAIMMQRLLLE